MELTAKEYVYNTSVVSAKQYDEHMKLYKGYVTKINEIWRDLQNPDIRSSANATYSTYRSLKKGETYSLDGVILHEGYFANMSMSNAVPGAKTKASFEEFFDGYNNWADDFTACARSARGWCIYGYDQRSLSFMNILLDAHDWGDVALFFPVLIIDMYEHAYFLDYGTDKNAYIKNFMAGINWDVVEKRMDAVR